MRTKKDEYNASSINGQHQFSPKFLTFTIDYNRPLRILAQLKYDRYPANK